MAHYTYIGGSIYLLDTDQEQTNQGLNILGNAIEAIAVELQNQGLRKDDQKLDTNDMNVFNANQYLWDHDEFCYVDNSKLPIDTPSDYQQVHIQRTTVNGHPIAKLYIPSAAKQDETIRRFMTQALPIVLTHLFGDKLMTIKIKEAHEYQVFTDTEDTVLLSTQR